MKRICLIVTLVLIILFSCDKELPPECKIVSPEPNAQYPLGTDIHIKIETNYLEVMLHEAKLFIDNELVSSYKRHPMKFTVRSDDYGIGQYSFKAVAVGETGLEGEDEIQVSIVVATPIISFLPMTGLTETSVNFNGILVNNGGDEKTVCGICWSTSPDPSINSDHTELSSVKDTFQIQVSGLTPSTSYYAKFYSVNESGISYSEEILFSTLVTANSAKDYDGNVYKLATIGDQVWMAENLKTTHYSNGSDLQLITDMYMSYWPLDATQNQRIYCYYGNSEDNGDTYGALYSWVTAVNGRLSTDEQLAIVQGVCPTGFHVPSDKEWEELELFLGMTEEEVILINDYRGEGVGVGGMLKDSSDLYWLDPNEGATNTSGFSTLPGGYINYAGSFIGKGTQTYYWTATEHEGFHYPIVRILSNTRSGVNKFVLEDRGGAYVRCIKN